VASAIIRVNNGKYSQLGPIAEENEKKSIIHACLPRKSVEVMIEISPFRNRIEMVAGSSPSAIKLKILWKFKIFGAFQNFFICIISL